MNIRKLFYSKRFFIVNLILVGIISGFLLSLLVFSRSSSTKPNDKVFVQETVTPSIEGLYDLQSTFRQVSAVVRPTVVELRIGEIAAEEEERRSPFDFFFGRPDGEPPQLPPGLGSGFIVESTNGVLYVATNEHVAGNAGSITVVTFDGSEYPGTLVGSDKRKDLAVVSFFAEHADLPSALLGDSDTLYVGDWVLAVGNPFGYASTVTAGIVSAKGRTGPSDNISDFIQTDAAINQGNSGGPLINLKGEVVGINTWISTPTGINVGLGFAIPINNIKKAIRDLIRRGDVEYGWLGVEVGDITEDIVTDLRYSETFGAVVYQLFKESPADKGGLQAGDIIIQIDGLDIRNYLHLTRYVGDIPPGGEAVFTVFRDGRQLLLDIVIGIRGDINVIENAYKKLWPGISVLRLTELLKERYGIAEDTQGMLISDVKYQTDALAAGLQPGDILLSINELEVKNLLDFYRIVNDTDKKEFVYSVLRNGETLSISFRRR